MHDLKDVTCDVHYENYRAQCIQQMTRWVPTASTGAGRGVSLSAELGLLSEQLVGQETVSLLGTCWAAAWGMALGGKVANPSMSPTV